MEEDNKNIIQDLNRSYFENVSFFSRQFCMPKEIQLLDSQDTNIGREIKNNIQIIDRLNYLDTNPVTRDILEIDLHNESTTCGDGLVSLVKHMEVQVCICVTVYSEDKRMLKKTLEGI